MRSYRQFCAVAKALDLIGERWNLLIVRELLIRGPSRYTDLLKGLPGIATNLLADRLRELEGSGLVEARAAPPPVATTLFQLTNRGRELEPVLQAIGSWGGRLLAERSEADAFRSHWLALPLKLHLSDRTPDGPPVTLELRTGEEPIQVQVSNGQVTIRPGPPGKADVTLSGPPESVIAVLSGRVRLNDARSRGVTYEGDAAVLRRLSAWREPGRSARGQSEPALAAGH